MLKRMALFLFVAANVALCAAEDVWVNGYYRKDGTYVDGYSRSRPNAYNWDNKDYAPSQPLYNNSYYNSNQNHNSNWYVPSETRYNDNNPYNDSPSYNNGQTSNGWLYNH